MRRQQADRSIISPLHETIDFLVDDDGRLLAILARASCQNSAREGIFTLTIGDGAEPLTHTPASHHLTRNGSDLLQVVFCTSRDVPNSYLLDSATTQSRHQPGFQVLLGVVVAIIQRCILRHTKCLATRNDRHFSDWINILLQ